MTATKAGPTDDARSEDEIFAPGGPVVPLRLGGIAKPIRQLPARKNEEWKRALADELGKRMSSLRQLDSTAAIASVFASVTDVQVALIVAYDVDGRLGGADWILDHAPAAEIWEAFKEVLRAAFPFLVDAARAPNVVAWLLPQLVELSTNSRSPSGDDPSTS